MAIFKQLLGVNIFYFSRTLQLIESNQINYSELFGFDIRLFQFFYFLQNMKKNIFFSGTIVLIKIRQIPYSELFDRDFECAISILCLKCYF